MEVGVVADSFEFVEHFVELFCIASLCYRSTLDVRHYSVRRLVCWVDWEFVWHLRLQFLFDVGLHSSDVFDDEFVGTASFHKLWKPLTNDISL